MTDRAPGRPADPTRRRRTLGLATDHVLAEGIEGLTLRSLATALETSPRMVLYDFGSKDQLLAEVLTEARRRRAALVAERFDQTRSPADALVAFWESLTAPDGAAWLRLILQLRAQVILGRADPKTLGDWLEPYRQLAEQARAPTADLHLISGAILGLLEQRQITGDHAAADAAFRRFLSVIRRTA